ncbi:tRNA (cytidine/uridine-2'-O-)-methyltransferase [Caminicella sporogenes DSM 14501]|uniref:Putative tRNA (cytidine(34)-2'-O)-methyltransferase n=1 Tax=Caminicella sporogenes DSM 14501 TaxID=1121266 RepID=A0A1M6MSN6_9FIRM|nr:tRNA (uridine(34)/cytosine(34)/5-carboxymethylaminomethyluridine(34)-2'-O)-methyltransferase TrmL [Caminicella sporogenes]RKD22521.1 tRNA (cytosine(34)-2'-O)-methyltransferase TrmL [Caminicella sporogenes]WIF94944.1 tRNA (uridine(34)/cytosine(34)/5-carboxymethylaminomethyluridine(34)-2'-O)-methyltransferase TrmL [Caminicella sporogenes]SHJ86416.1 tRNA (cytidine/uridine-2'-O-)-methyltransferase [Caminicella sporogenes DSM 14501]
MAFNIVLYQPDIPQNTGNIARTCAITGSSLHLIKPLGFSLEDKYLKRAGLDYWRFLDIHIYENLGEFFEKYPDGKFYFATTKGAKIYTDVKYEENCFLVFGKETAGLPDEIHKKYKDRCIKIPMIKDARARSLNLSNSVAIVLYEVLRQHSFPNMF